MITRVVCGVLTVPRVVYGGVGSVGSEQHAKLGLLNPIFHLNGYIVYSQGRIQKYLSGRALTGKFGGVIKRIVRSKTVLDDFLWLKSITQGGLNQPRPYPL